MDKDFCQVKSQGRQRWGQGLGCQTWGYSASPVLRLPPTMWPQSLGWMSYLPYLLWLALKGTPYQALGRRNWWHWWQWPQQRGTRRGFRTFCHKNKRRTTSGETLSHWTGPSLSDMLCSKFTNSTLHSCGPAQPVLTVDPKGPHFTPGSSLLADRVNRWPLEYGFLVDSW